MKGSQYSSGLAASVLLVHAKSIANAKMVNFFVSACIFDRKSTLSASVYHDKYMRVQLIENMRQTSRKGVDGEVWGKGCDTSVAYRALNMHTTLHVTHPRDKVIE